MSLNPLFRINQKFSDDNKPYTLYPAKDNPVVLGKIIPHPHLLRKIA
jgi:hypothetical protein